MNMDYIVTEYVYTEQEKYIKNELTQRDISFKRGKGCPWLSIFKTFEKTDYTIFNKGCFDFSPILSIFTPQGEYGYSKIDIYESDLSFDLILVYEYQYKGQIQRKYYVVSTHKG